MANVNMIVFQKFQALYGPPRSENPDMTMDLYEQALEGYEDAILERAVGIVIDEHEFATWPTIAAIKKACNKVIATDPRLRPHVAGWDVPKFEDVKPDPETKARVAALVKAATETIKKKAAGTQIEPPDFAKIFPNAHDWMKMLATTPNHELHGINLEQQEAIREAYGMTAPKREAAE